MLLDLIAYAGHRVHVVRAREVPALLSRLGNELSGTRLLDVGGGDGYWAGRARSRGATAVAIDLNHGKLRRGMKLRDAPLLVGGDALRLPFPDATFDAVLSVCAIEHFEDGATAAREMARILRPGGDLVISADCLSRGPRWPSLDAGHRRRYHVVRTYDHEELATLLSEAGFETLAYSYLFRGSRGEHLYLQLSRFRIAWNAAAPLAPLVRRWDRTAGSERGSVVLLHARRRDGR